MYNSDQQYKFAQRISKKEHKSSFGYTYQDEDGIWHDECKDPKCSLECRDRWAKQMATCIKVFNFYKGDGKLWFRGNISMPSNATQEDHDNAISNAKKGIRRSNRRIGQHMRPMLIPHVTEDDTKHYDVIMWTEGHDQEDAKREFYKVMRDAGFTRPTCIPIEAQEDFDSWTAYVVKVGDTNKECPEVHHIHNRNGTENAYWCRGFFEGLSRPTCWHLHKANFERPIPKGDNVPSKVQSLFEIRVEEYKAQEKEKRRKAKERKKIREQEEKKREEEEMTWWLFDNITCWTMERGAKEGEDIEHPDDKTYRELGDKHRRFRITDLGDKYLCQGYPAIYRVLYPAESGACWYENEHEGG